VKEMSNKGEAVSVVIPTLNGERYLPELLEMILRQEPRPPDEIIVMDSESTDRTRNIAQVAAKTRVEIISDFSHGRARNRGVRQAQGNFVVLMSQDAVPIDRHWLRNLLQPFGDPRVAATFSRQVPQGDASPMERFFLATHFPEGEPLYMQRDGHEDVMFQREVFFSNVSAAMRRSLALEYPFDEGLIMSEDQQFAKDVIVAGYAVVYAPASVVIHSHNYSNMEAFQRYFDSVYSLTKIFPKHSLFYSARLGLSYLWGEAGMMLKNHPRDLPRYSVYVLAKALGTVLGHFAEQMPRWLAKKMSLHSEFWNGGKTRGMGRGCGCE